VAGFSDSLYFRSIMAATLMVIYDIPLEPYAIYFDMWNWGGAVPLQNYLAWFVISLVLHLVLYRWKLMESPNKVARPLFFIQMGFFLILNGWFLVERLWV
jgi:putative membrane protein